MTQPIRRTINDLLKFAVTVNEFMTPQLKPSGSVLQSRRWWSKPAIILLNGFAYAPFYLSALAMVLLINLSGDA